MPNYRTLGDVPRKRHLRVRSDRPGEGLLFEELMGEEGFSGDSSLLYHRRSPSALVDAKAVDSHEPVLVPNQPLLPHHLRTPVLSAAAGGDPVTGRAVLLANDDLVVSWVAADSGGPLYRNAVGDEVVYVQAGSAVLESVFGRMTVGAGDYVVIPASTTHRWVVDVGSGGVGGVGGGPLELLVVEARGHIRPPRRYLSPTGQFLEQAPYCERDIRSPDWLVSADGDDGSVDVLVRHRGGLTRHTLASHPFDVVGWDGCVYPWALSIHDFEPIVGSIHQPPHVHQTFEGRGFVVCSFVPRPYDFHPGAIKVPYHHANVDSDEVIFYSAGDFMSRAGFRPRPAARQHGTVRRPGPHRGGGRDDRHLPPPLPGPRRPRHHRPHLPLELVLRSRLIRAITRMRG
jgi:homogentisate 1,2-dioxygenase